MSQKKGNGEKKPGNHAAFDGTATILDYLKKQNRPYSAVEISANLHNKVTKACAAKALRELCQKKKIEGRASGKQSVYHALQDSSDGNAAEVIESLDHDIKKFQDQLTTLRAHEKQTRAELAEFAARPLLSEIRSDIGRFQGEKDRMIAELGKPGEDISETMPAEEQEGIEKEWKYWQRQANVRRRICRELWGRCSEVLPDDMTEDELKESLGLEGL